MSPIKIAIIVGSLRKDSINRKLARAIEKLAPPDLVFEHIRIDDLPLYSQDFDADYPAIPRRLKKDIEAADALLFVTPEYNRSVPGVLKNAIDFASRPWGTNSFAGKPGAMIGASIGATGSALAQQHLRNILAYVDVEVLGQPEVFIQFTDGLISDDGTIANEDTKKFLQAFVDRYAAWVRHLVKV
jgi:chromate reductase, NAD(P)H dehydrogenase (quinone)